MSSDVAVRVRGLGKAYHLYASPQDRLRQGLWRGRRTFYQEFWALRGVSFDVARGETLGIVGRNGSGKSTLLQIIAHTLEPTEGECHVQGRVAALLELGAGFAPEFTGIENVYMNAAILGLSRRQIASRIDSIRAFADIGGFFSRPVKTYSSGMFLRLAFATAIHLEPDVLVIDEALSVGDEAFQRKCYARLNELKASGVTILFVSHSASTVVELCDRALLLDAGERLLFEAPKPVVTRYHQLIFAAPDRAGALRETIKELDRQGREEGLEADQSRSIPAGGSVPPGAPASRYDPELKPKSTTYYPSRGARIRNPRVLSASEEPINVLARGEAVLYRYRVDFEKTVHRVRFGMLVKTISGVEVGGLISHPEGKGIETVAAGTSLEVTFRFASRFVPGVYFLNAGCTARVEGEEVYLHRAIDVYMLRVEVEPDCALSGYSDISVGRHCEVVEIEAGEERRHLPAGVG